MQVRVLTADFGPTEGSAKVVAESYVRALRAVGWSADLRTVDIGKNRRHGGYVKPVLKMILNRWPLVPDLVYVTTHWGLAWRGIDVLFQADFDCYSHPGLGSRVQRFCVERGIRHAPVLLVPSEQTARESVQLFGEGIRPKVVVLAPSFPPPPEGPHPIERDLLWVGTRAPRKGLVRLLEALLEVPGPLAVTLVAHPGDDPAYEALVQERLPAVRRRHNVEWVEGFLPPSRMQELYRSSRCLVSTSTYEGYHMPPVEAYLWGTGLVLPEIPLYLEVYGRIDGVTYYRDDLSGALVARLRAPSFRPDPAFVRTHTDEFAGHQLAQLVERIVQERTNRRARS